MNITEEIEALQSEQSVDITRQETSADLSTQDTIIIDRISDFNKRKNEDRFVYTYSRRPIVKALNVKETYIKSKFKSVTDLIIHVRAPMLMHSRKLSPGRQQ
jgi:hypothetical protein